jgi:2-succinyl-6-hydroxy-2,4-cyclohexadiene-1-carboxylate synthase
VSSLATDQWGSGSLIVACHGFTQTAQSWGAFGELLGTRHRVLAVDLPGHGRSASIATSLEETAQLVLAVADGEPFDLLGYSLGGRVALTLALTEPTALQRLILIGASPGIADPAARGARKEADDALAAQIEAEDDLEAFLERWLRQPMFATLARANGALASRRTNTVGGLAASLRTLGVGNQEPSWDQLGTLLTPTLALVGIGDTRFTATNLAMVDALGDATLSLIPGARHACHLEQPSLSAHLVLDWLDR